MCKKRVEVKFNNGLNLLACIRMANIVSKFRSKLWLQKDDKIADSRSVIELLSLGICRSDKINLLADGEDEDKVVDVLQSFFTDSETMNKITP